MTELFHSTPTGEQVTLVMTREEYDRIKILEGSITMPPSEGKPRTTDGPNPLVAPCEEEIAAVEALGTKLSEDFAIIASRMQRDMDALAIIQSGMQRCVRRMEVLRQTVRPLPPIDPKTDDNRLCAGERAIIAVLKNGMCYPARIKSLTRYAEGSLRTWMPMLKQKGIIEITHDGFVVLSDPIPEQYRAIVDAIPPHQDL